MVGAALVSAVLIAVVVLPRITSAKHPASAPAAALSTVLDPPNPPEALIFVSGAVGQPGLYRLSTAARVTDAIAAAGGITTDADPGRLPNLAARVHDGRQINVPFRKSTKTGMTATARLDLNTATTDELAAVPGMPAGLPDAIVQYRTDWGAFTSVNDLHSALGIDSVTLTGLRPYLTVVRQTP